MMHLWYLLLCDSLFFCCLKCVAIFDWTRTSPQVISSRSRYPIYHCFFLSNTKTTLKEHKKKLLLFHLCVRCSWNAYPNVSVSVFVKRIYALFFFLLVHFAHILGFCYCLFWRQIGYQIPELCFRLETSIQVRFVYIVDICTYI